MLPLIIMTSTRNKNSVQDYNQEIRRKTEYTSYRLFDSYGKTKTANLPIASGLPSKMSRENLSHNSIDIENRLFGIGSSNLVNPQSDIAPNLKEQTMISFFDRNTCLIMPEKLVINTNEREGLNSVNN